MASRLADRLAAARRRFFVGRTPEQVLFRSALNAADLPFYLLHIVGPGGVGKTSLLRQFLDICHQTQTPATYVDGHDIDPTPDSFLNTLQLALGLAPTDPPFDSLTAETDRRVLLIDTYELLAPLDGWLRQEFLPQLPDQHLTVLAGREPLSAAWRTDPGWQRLIHTVPLRNLTPDETLTYLTDVAIPAEQHQAVLKLTHGHPLALSLISDTFAQRGDVQLHSEAVPDMIKTLLERLVQKVPGPAHRTALEACAIVRVTTESLLAEMLALPAPGEGSDDGVHELFEWLRGLSFIEARPGGLFPHDIVRDALATDLRWRNPDWYIELHRRARTYYNARVTQGTGQSQQRLLLDYTFLHRHNPVVKPYLEWQTSGSIPAGSLRADDIPALTAMVRAHEGDDSAKLAQYWFEQQPEGVVVFRDLEDRPEGFVARVDLNRAGTEASRIDPAVEATWHYLKRYAPLRPGEKATLFRFWMGRDSYQAVSPIQSLVFVQAVRHYLTTPGLAFTFFPCAEPDFWAPAFAYADLTRLPEADFEVGGRQYGVYGHDWRSVPPAAWLALLAERELALAPEVEGPRPVAEPLAVLSRPDFEQAVREALQDYTRPDALPGNPLLRSRLIIERTDPEADPAIRAAALQALLKEAATSLQSSPRETKFYRALHHIYFQPASTQEQAAELLNVSFSTFRRHLKAGVTRMTEILWQQEIAGLE